VGDGNTFRPVPGKPATMLTSAAAAGSVVGPTSHWFSISGMCSACAETHNHNRKCEFYTAALRKNTLKRGKGAAPRASALPSLPGGDHAERDAEFATRARNMGYPSGAYCERHVAGRPCVPKCHRAHIDTTWTAPQRAAPAHRPPPAAGNRATTTAWVPPPAPPTADAQAHPPAPATSSAEPPTQGPSSPMAEEEGEEETPPRNLLPSLADQK
jgi:hypothetical protein